MNADVMAREMSLIGNFVVPGLDLNDFQCDLGNPVSGHIDP